MYRMDRVEINIAAERAMESIAVKLVNNNNKI